MHWITSKKNKTVLWPVMTSLWSSWITLCIFKQDIYINVQIIIVTFETGSFATYEWVKCRWYYAIHFTPDFYVFATIMFISVLCHSSGKIFIHTVMLCPSQIMMWLWSERALRGHQPLDHPRRARYRLFERLKYTQNNSSTGNIILFGAKLSSENNDG